MRIEPCTIRLCAVLEKVRKEHPNQGTARRTPSGDLIAEVRQRLKECPYKDIKSLAFSFDGSMLTACLEILVHGKEQDLAKKAASVLLLRPRELTCSIGWSKLIKNYPDDLLESLIKSLSEIIGFGWTKEVKEHSELIPSWFLSQRVSEGIFKSYQRSRAWLNYDEYLQSNCLYPEYNIYVESWRSLLSQGNSLSLLKESPIRILVEYEKPENGHHQQAFCRNYLNNLYRDNKWDERIFKYIKRKFGVPQLRDQSSLIETPFWAEVKPDAIEAFRKWALMESIQDFFEGERAEFWKTYVAISRIKNAKSILENAGFMLDFGAFGVVEFKNIGNAAYIYPEEVFQSYWKRADAVLGVALFKDRKQTIRHWRYPGWDGRIIHRGDWKIEAMNRINTLIGS